MNCIVDSCGQESPGHYQLISGLPVALCYDCAKKASGVLKRKGNPVLVSHFSQQTTAQCLRELFIAQYNG